MRRAPVHKSPLFDGETIPVMANIIPWNEAVLRGDRTFKTLHYNWSYRGPVLLYNSKSPADADAARAYGIDTDAQPRGAVVGVADVVGCTRHSSGEWHVTLDNPRRYTKPVPFAWPRGAIRIARARRGDFAELLVQKAVTHA